MADEDTNETPAKRLKLDSDDSNKDIPCEVVSTAEQALSEVSDTITKGDNSSKPESGEENKTSTPQDDTQDNKKPDEKNSLNDKPTGDITDKDDEKADDKGAEKNSNKDDANTGNKTKPTADETKPDDDEIKSDADKTKSDADKTKPDDDETKSDADKTKSNADETKPDDDEAKSDAKSDADKTKPEKDEKKADKDEDSMSDVSEMSGLSDLSGEESWKAKPAGPGSISWVYACMSEGVDPRTILSQVLPDDSGLADSLDDLTLWKMVINLVSEPPPRTKLTQYNTLDDALHLLKTCQKIVVLTGAGVSVSCGIPDFRSKNGIYARLAVDFPDLPDPQAMFDIRYFKREQRPFFKFAKEIYPGQFEPSKSHKFIQLIEEHGKLLRNYTQNIDTLEQVAGIKNVIQCHGSFATATCMACKHKMSSDEVKEDILNQVIPKCPKCDPDTRLAVMKPDIVFFGESLPEEFHDQMAADKGQCDLLIVIGSSLKVRPVALIPNSLPPKVPQILINKEHLRNLNFDVELLGDCDTVIEELCRRLGDDWSTLAGSESMTQVLRDDLPTPPLSPVREDNSEPLTGAVTPSIKQAATEKPKEGTSSVKQAATEKPKEETQSTKQAATEKSGEENPSKANGSGDKSEHSDTNTTRNTDCAESHSKPDSSEIKSDKSSDVTCESGSQEIENENTKTENSVSADTDNAKATDNENVTENTGKDNGNSNSDKSKITFELENKSQKQEDHAKPGPSSGGEKGAGEPKPGTSGNQSKPVEFRRIWRPFRQNLALRLESNQYCFIPPHQYVFPHAEYMVRLSSPGPIDVPITSTSKSYNADLDRTHNTSSSYDGDFIDLISSDDECAMTSDSDKDSDSEGNEIEDSIVIDSDEDTNDKAENKKSGDESEKKMDQ